VGPLAHWPTAIYYFETGEADETNSQEKLDGGWPESVEEQGLLLLAWRHHITKQYLKDVL